MMRNLVVAPALAFASVGAMLLNRALSGPLAIGVVFFVSYLFINASIVKNRFWDLDYKLLLSVLLVLCLVIVTEALILILNEFYLLTVSAVLLAIPIGLALISGRDSDYGRCQIGHPQQRTKIESGLSYAAVLLSIPLIFAELLLWSFRSGNPAFSVFGVIPEVAWPVFFAAYALFVFGSLAVSQRTRDRFMSVPAVLITFLFSGVYITIASYGFDSTPFVETGLVKILLSSNTTTGAYYSILERGMVALWASVSKISVSAGAYGALAEWSFVNFSVPVIASIFLPLFTYLILIEVAKPKSKSVAWLASVTPLILLPVFIEYLEAAPLAAGAIFMLPMLYFGIKFVKLDSNHDRGFRYLGALILCFLTGVIIDETVGAYALGEIILVLIVKSVFNWSQSVHVKTKELGADRRLGVRERESIGLIFILILSSALSVIPLLSFVFGGSVLTAIQPLTVSELPGFPLAFSLDRVGAFFSMPPIFAPLDGLSYANILGIYFNWVRIVILLPGVTLLLMKERGIASRLVAGAGLYSFVAWFLQYSALPSFSLYGFNRLSFMADILLLPVAAYLLYRIIERTVISRFSLRRAAVLTICMAVIVSSFSGVAMSFGSSNVLGFPPTVGRPTSRFVATGEIEACSYIGGSSVNYAVVVSDEWVEQVCSAFISQRGSYVGNHQNLIDNFSTIQNFLETRNVTVLQAILPLTLSRELFLVFGDYYLAQTQFNAAYVLRLEGTPGIQVHVFGTGYEVFVISYSPPIR